MFSLTKFAMHKCTASFLHQTFEDKREGSTKPNKKERSMIALLQNIIASHHYYNDDNDDNDDFLAIDINYLITRLHKTRKFNNLISINYQYDW